MPEAEFDVTKLFQLVVPAYDDAQLYMLTVTA